MYYFPDNTLSQVIDFSLEKSVLVGEFLRETVPTNEKFLNETNYNPKKNVEKFKFSLKFQFLKNAHKMTWNLRKRLDLSF